MKLNGNNNKKESNLCLNVINCIIHKPHSNTPIYIKEIQSTIINGGIFSNLI